MQSAKHFSPKREYNSTRLFGELCGVWCQLSQHMDLDLPCQCSHIICSDYNNLHPAPPTPQKKNPHMHICVVFTCFKSYLLHFPSVDPNTRVSLHSEVLFEALFRSCNNHTGLRRVFFLFPSFPTAHPTLCVFALWAFPFLSSSREVARSTDLQIYQTSIRIYIFPSSFLVSCAVGYFPLRGHAIDSLV